MWCTGIQRGIIGFDVVPFQTAIMCLLIVGTQEIGGIFVFIPQIVRQTVIVIDIAFSAQIAVINRNVVDLAIDRAHAHNHRFTECGAIRLGTDRQSECDRVSQSASKTDIISMANTVVFRSSTQYEASWVTSQYGMVKHSYSPPKSRMASSRRYSQ